MSWWKRKTKAGASDASCCDVCGEEVTSGSRTFEFLQHVYIADGERKFARCLCENCWQGHLAFEREALDRFRRENPLEDLCAALHGDSAAREDAARKLQRFGDRRAVGALSEALAREPELDRSACAIIDALAALGGPEAEINLMSELSKERVWRGAYSETSGWGSPPAQVWIIPALLKMGGTNLVVRALLDTMMPSKTPKSVRMAVVDELANIAYRSASDAPYQGVAMVKTDYGEGFLRKAEKLSDEDRALMIEPLRAALHDESAKIRDSAERALSHLEGPRGASG